MYAREIFERYGADATTVNPYPGLDSMQPYLDYGDRGVFVLCRTSNPGGAELQHLKLDDGSLLFEFVARSAARDWNRNGNIGLVVGATRPAEIRRVRHLCPGMMFLMPGVGAQGADIKEMVTAGQGGGMLVSSSRAVLYAGKGEDFAEASRLVALRTREQINRYNSPGKATISE